MVKQYLRRWFVSQGGVKVIARRQLGRNSSFAEPRYDGSTDIPELAGLLGRQRSSSYNEVVASAAFKKTEYVPDLRSAERRTSCAGEGELLATPELPVYVHPPRVSIGPQHAPGGVGEAIEPAARAAPR